MKIVYQRIIQKIFGTPLENYHYLALNRFLKKQKVDLVLAQYGPYGMYLTDACRELNLPLVTYFYGYDAYKHETLQKFDNYRKLFATADALVTVAYEMKQQLISLGAMADKVHYNPPGVNLELFEAKENQSTEKLLLAIGRFTDKKAPEITLLAFQNVLNDIPDARLVMVGDGHLLDACQRLAKGLKIAHAVEFKGRCTHEETAILMKEARAFVQHSVIARNGDSEGTPVAVLEAMASELPVISTRHVGIKETVLEGQTGLLVNEGDVAGMAANMKTVLLDEDLAIRLGKEGRKRVKENFRLDQYIDGLSAIIEDVLKKRRGNL